MSTVICAPQLTMRHPEIAEEFYQQCKTLLEEYVLDVKCILSYDLLNQAIDMQVTSCDLLVFFTAEDGCYDVALLELI